MLVQIKDSLKNEPWLLLVGAVALVAALMGVWSVLLIFVAIACIGFGASKFAERRWQAGANEAIEAFAQEVWADMEPVWNRASEPALEQSVQAEPKRFNYDAPKLLDVLNQNPWQGDELNLIYGVKSIGDTAGTLLTRRVTESDHVLIGAAPRGGKSYMASSLVFQALLPALNGEPDRVHVALADVTGVTFPSGTWDGLPQLFTGEVAETPEQILKLLGAIETEVTRRQELFKQHEGVQKLKDYNRVAAKAEPYLLVFIEELPATLAMLGPKKVREAFMSTLFRVPKYGVYFYGLAQRLTIDTLGPGRDAFGTRMWFRRVPQNVKPILDIPSDMQVSENKQGRAVYVFGDEVGEFQSATVEPRELLELVKLLKRDASNLKGEPIGLLA